MVRRPLLDEALRDAIKNFQSFCVYSGSLGKLSETLGDSGPETPGLKYLKQSSLLCPGFSTSCELSVTLIDAAFEKLFFSDQHYKTWSKFY